MKYYLAYGSNLDLEHMNHLCPKAKFLGITKVSGFKLAFRGEHLRSYLTTLVDDNSSIDVGVFQISEDCEKLLDYYEAYPILYLKNEINFTFNGSIHKGLIYVMKDNYKFNQPKDEYVNMVIKAFNYHKLDILPIENALNNK